MFWGKKEEINDTTAKTKIDNKLGWFGKQLNKNIRMLQESNLNAIPWIFCVLTEKHTPSKVVAAKVLCEILSKFTFDETVRVYEQMRQTTSMEWSINWRNISMESLFTDDMNENERRAVIIFASFNPNGFIREQAVLMMKNYRGTLPFIILRQNDWVKQVRDAAFEVSDYRLQNLSDGELLESLPFVDKLSKCWRTKHSYIEKFYDILASPENADTLEKGLIVQNIKTRKICINTLFNSQNPRFDLAFKFLKTEPGPFLRAIIFKGLKSSGQNIDMAVSTFLADKFPMNRILAFQYLCEKKNENSIEISKQLLLDKNGAVRDYARYFIEKQIPNFDYRAFYKKHLENYTVSSIMGLGEVGNTSDTEMLESYINNEKISIIKATMTSLIRLNNKKYGSIIIEMLTDKRVGIVKTARNLIIKYDDGSTDYERIWEIFLATEYEYTKVKCLSVLVTTSKWERIILLLKALTIDNPKICELVITSIQRWLNLFNKSFTSPTVSQVCQIRQLLQVENSNLPSNLRQRIQFSLPKNN